MPRHKKSAAVLQHRDAKVHANTLKSSIPAAWRGVKQLACGFCALFAALFAMLFYGSLVEGLAAWWVSLLGCLVCVALACWLYRLADREV